MSPAGQVKAVPVHVLQKKGLSCFAHYLQYDTYLQEAASVFDSSLELLCGFSNL